MQSLKGAMVHPDHSCIGASWLWANASCFLKIKCRTSAPALPLLGCPSSSCKTGSGSRCSPLWLVRTMVTWFASVNRIGALYSATRTSGPEWANHSHRNQQSVALPSVLPQMVMDLQGGHGANRLSIYWTPTIHMANATVFGGCNAIWYTKTQMLQDVVSAIKWIIYK